MSKRPKTLTRRQKKKAKMRYVQIKEAVRIPNTTPTKMLSFLEVVRDVWLNHPEQFGAGAAAVRASMKLDTLFSKYKEKDFVPVEDADWQRLKTAAETANYNPAVARHILSFIDSVVDASTEDPTKSSKETTPENEAVS
jgi:hypothetical protein